MQARSDSARRNAIEGKFSEGKTGYGLDRVRACIKDSAETVIALSFFCMNISRRLRVLLRRFFDWLKIGFLIGVLETEFEEWAFEEWAFE